MPRTLVQRVKHSSISCDPVLGSQTGRSLASRAYLKRFRPRLRPRPRPKPKHRIVYRQRPGTLLFWETALTLRLWGNRPEPLDV